MRLELISLSGLVFIASASFMKVAASEAPRSWAYADRVAIKVTKDPKTFDPRLMGANIVYHDESDAEWSDGKLKGYLDQLGVRFLRYPGGELTSRFHFLDQQGEGFIDTWESPSSRPSPSEWMNANEYIDIIAESSTAIALGGLNVESDWRYRRDPDDTKGEPIAPPRDEFSVTDGKLENKPNGVPDYLEEAAAFVGAWEANEKGVDTDWWFIDNESDLKQSHAQMSVERYSTYIKEIVPVIKRENPDARIIVNWHNSWGKEWIYLLTSAVDENGSPLIDMIDVHPYWAWGEATFENWKSRGPILRNGDSGPGYQDFIKRYQDGLEALGLEEQIEIGFFEWNAGRPPEENPPSRYELSLINAQLFMSFAEAGLNAAAYWPLKWDRGEARERGLFDVNTQDPTPTYNMLELFTPALGGDVARATSASMTPVLAVKQQTEMYIYLLNKRSEFTGSTVSFDGNGPFGGDGLFEVDAIAHTAPGTIFPTANETAGTSGLTEAETALRTDAPHYISDQGEIKVILAPFSLTRIRLTRTGE